MADKPVATGYVVDRVVICDAYAEPEKHYELLASGKSKLATGRRPSMRFLASAKDVKGGIAGVVGKQAGLFDDLSAAAAEQNEFVSQLREEVRAWREGYPGTAVVTRRLLEWWFERDEERKAIAKRFFFCQQEAVEIVIYLYEVQGRRRTPATGDLLRYALKLATGTGKTVVMALLVTWATLHKSKVSGSSLSMNFLVLVPNLTVRDRVSGQPRGDGLDPAGEKNLYDSFEMVPPGYREEFHPNVLVRNWQGIPLEGKRDDWLDEDAVPLEEGAVHPTVGAARDAPACEAGSERADPPAAGRLAGPRGHQRRGPPRLWREAHEEGRGPWLHQVEPDPRSGLERPRA